MILIIGEKQDTARKIKAFLAPDAKWHSASKYSGYYENKDYCITALAGHIFTLKEPQEINEDYKRWDLDQLPLKLPKDWPLSPNQKSTTYDAKIFPMIKGLWTRKDIKEVIVCTDPDREGQLIWGYVEQMLPSIPAYISRAWFTEWSPEKMKEAIENRRPNTEYKNLETAGRCRAIGDAIEGYNGTRAVTCKYGQGKDLFSIGRVQTFTQYLVYQKEREIQDFKEEEYTTLSLCIESEEDEKTISLLHKTPQNLSATQAQALKETIEADGDSVVVCVQTKKTSQKSLKLYSTTSIQKEMDKKHGFSAEKTLKILQKLYSPEYALTTYPRTALDQISRSNAQHHALQALKNLKGTGILEKEIDRILSSGWSISNHLVSKQESLPHEAITPVFGQIQKEKIQQLSGDERIVYEAIVARFVQGFFPDAILEQTKITAQKVGETFETTGKRVISAGFLEVSGMEKETILPLVNDGKAYPIVSIDLQDKKTKPASRYTEATLLEAMEKAGRFTEDKENKEILRQTGVGTDATRAGIIETLFKRDYIYKKGKTLYPTDKTMKLFDVLPQTPLTSADSTANMERLLNEIQEGIRDMESYFQEVDHRTREFVSAIQQQSVAFNYQGSGQIGVCPKCGGAVIKSPKGWQCTNWRNGCSFTIWETIAHKKLHEKQAKQLLEEGKTEFIRGFRSKEGKEFQAQLTFKKEAGAIDYDHLAFVFSQESKTECPCCKQILQEDGNRLYCEQCGFSLYKNVLGVRLKEKDLEALLEGKPTRLIKGFVSTKTKKKFSARLCLDEEHKMKFLFDEADDVIGACPICHQPIMENSKSYYCSGWKQGCKTTIWKNALSYRGVETITKKEAKELLKGKSIRMKFCSKKTEKDYYGYVYFDPDTQKIEVELAKNR